MSKDTRHTTSPAYILRTNGTRGERFRPFPYTTPRNVNNFPHFLRVYVKIYLFFQRNRRKRFSARKRRPRVFFKDHANTRYAHDDRTGGTQTPFVVGSAENATRDRTYTSEIVGHKHACKTFLSVLHLTSRCQIHPTPSSLPLHHTIP